MSSEQSAESRAQRCGGGDSPCGWESDVEGDVAGVRVDETVVLVGVVEASAGCACSGVTVGEEEARAGAGRDGQRRRGRGHGGRRV